MNIITWLLFGLLVSAVWVGIIWAIGKYTPSPWWGLLCLPALVSVPFVDWLFSCIEKKEKELDARPDKG